MTDEVNSMGSSAPVSQVSEPVSASVVTESATPASQELQASQASEPEQRQQRVYYKDEVDKIARRATEVGKEKAIADYERKLSEERAKQYGMSNQGYQQQPAPQQGYGANVQPGQSLEMTRQQLQQIAFEEGLKAEADSLSQKIIADRGKYQDFDAATDVMNDLVNSHTARIYNGYDNAADVIYHLAKNPEVIPSILFKLKDEPFKTETAILSNL